MKILMLSQGLPFPTYRDGLTIRVFHLLKEFAKAAQCHLLAFAEYAMTAEEIGILGGMATYDIVKYNPPGGVAGVVRKALSRRRYYSSDFEERIRETLSRFKPDVVFAEQTFMAQYVELFRDRPCVMSAVDAISLAAWRQSKMPGAWTHALPLRYVACQRLAVEKQYFPKFDKVTVVAEDDAAFLRHELKCEISVVPNGVDAEYFNPKLLKPQRASVLFTGNLSAAMNEEACMHLLEEVFPAVHAIRPDVPIVVAGRGITRKIRSVLLPYVTVEEDVADMRAVLSNALLYVSPIQYGTGIKNNVLQAMAMGVPVVATKMISDPIGMCHGETGFVTKRGADFAKTILAVLEDRNALERVGNAGRRHIETRFAWSSIASTYLEMFAKAMRQRGNGAAQSAQSL